MRYPLVLTLCFGLAISTIAQIPGKFYYNKHWELTSKDSAVYIRMCVYDTANGFFAGPVLDMYRDSKPQMRGSFQMLMKNGDFTTYYSNGQIESTGKFVNDLRSGVWKYYYQNGQEKLVVDYSSTGKKVLSMKDSTGVYLVRDGTGKYTDRHRVYRKPEPVIVTGQFKSYEKEGDWESYLASGKKLYSQKYQAGEMTKGVVYPDGKTPERNELDYDNVDVLPYKYQITESFVAGPGFRIADYISFLRRVDLNTSDSARASNDLLEDYLPEPEITEVVLQYPSSNSGLPATMSAHPDVDINLIYHEVTKELRWPDEARRLKYQGSGRAEFVVNKDGTPGDFVVVSSTGYKILDDEALRALKVVVVKHKWIPATMDGRTVSHTLSFPFNFQLKSR